MRFGSTSHNDMNGSQNVHLTNISILSKVVLKIMQQFFLRKALPSAVHRLCRSATHFVECVKATKLDQVISDHINPE